MYADLSEPELRSYRSSQLDPADFDEFWSTTLTEARTFDLDVRVEQVDTGLTTVDVFDITFAGYGGEPIKAWLRLPAGASAPLPAVVEYAGYSGGRGRPIDHLLWASAGFAHFQMDSRGQGGGISVGDTPDPHGSGSQAGGFLTRGIESRDTYYYRRLFTDAVRAVEAARALDAIDSSRVAVLGGSQGGGIALAVAGLVPDLSAVVALVPFLCDFPRSMVMSSLGPYDELVKYFAVHRERLGLIDTTLPYFDAVNFAKRAVAPAWLSVALMDRVCPPSSVFGAFQAYKGEKDIAIWPFNEHEGGGIDDDARALEALRGAFAVRSLPARRGGRRAHRG